MQRLDQRKEQLVFSHAACSYYKWVWLQVNFEGVIFAGRMKFAKTSKFKRLENKALYSICIQHVLHSEAQLYRDLHIQLVTNGTKRTYSIRRQCQQVTIESFKTDQCFPHPHFHGPHSASGINITQVSLLDWTDICHEISSNLTMHKIKLVC